jgi:class 3 adenylate cyclase
MAPKNRQSTLRMAIHNGAAQLRVGNCYGPAANRTARLLETGNGGHIILSSTTKSLVRESLPPNTSLLDLGQQWLRDIMRPNKSIS